ncbi:YceI family protein [Tunturiibacter gelidoferens]|jgi:polyisoprenoid-binding protein YceI|uniref:Polyisoprenoid-binding protein YceI n=1 Tax=Tunturiibacter gelidiferens TaxID=3069689 RepID=A0A9X0QIU3_9BACT|nr:YceI family protein [Edaphobacter lichenicola]MBB5330929.1 polyisoprenoid-binding protein YceI [Edaphobacter lichenicola]
MSTTVATPAITTWNVDSTHSVVEFKIKHMMISNLKGNFTSVTGTLSLDENDLTQSSVEAAIEIASIHTRDEGRDAHLKGADFFDAEQFPTMQLKSTHIALKSDGEVVVTGDLMIKGVTHSVQFAVEGPSPATKDPWGNTRIGLSATTKINRKDFGLTWNAALEAGGLMVGEDVSITLDLEFLKDA